MAEPAPQLPTYTPEQLALLKDRAHAAMEKVRPFINNDGGDVDLVDITPEGIAIVQLSGHCENCSLSPMTMKLGIERMLLSEVPEIRGVEHV